jgi:hypothetical protein
MHSTLLATLLFISIAFGQITVNYKAGANVTLSNGNDFSFRRTAVTDVSIPLLYNAIFVQSVALSVTPGTAEYDALFGSAYAGLGNAPTGYIAYYDSQSKWTVSTNYANASVNAAQGFVGSVYISLEEVDAQGAVKQTFELKNLLWTVEKKEIGNGGLKYVTFLGKRALVTPNFETRVTYIVSDVVGVLDVAGQAVVTPKSIESIFEVKNFPYQSTANSVRLNIGVGTATGSVQAEGSLTRVVSGSGSNSAYFIVDSTAQVDGAVKTVSITTTAAGQASSTFGNSNFVGQVNSKYGASAEFKIVSATFPAGATTFLLDPSVGAGSAPPQVGASAHMVPSLFLVFAALLKLLM